MSKKVKLTQNAEEVAKARYYNNGEDWESCTRRVAEAVASVEKDKAGYTEKFHEMIYNMDFLPAGRILRNAGIRSNASLLNCYVLPIDDSIESIGEFIKNSLCLWSQGGGVGSNFSLLRPKGDPILGKGGKSSGMVSFIGAADSVSKTIESGGQRRAAALACCDVSHPEIINFINAKLVDKELSHFNISVLVNENFIRAVENDEDWTFKFKQKEYEKIRARDLWDLIIKNMIDYAEPGLLNSTNLYKNNSWYYDPVVSTNPCITGETLVSVADGRTSVSIKQLAKEGKDVPVYSMNNDGAIEIKYMRNPRITGYNQKILKITLDDGSIIRCTENHKFILKDGNTKEASDLLIDDRLHHMTKTVDLNKKGKKEYITMNNGLFFENEHKLVGEFKIGRPYNYQENEVTHHLDGNPQNNDPKNIIVITQNEYDRLHQLGDNNVMRDKWWNSLNEDRKNEYRENMSRSTSGEKNGNWYGYTREQIKESTKEFILTLGREINANEWVDFCKLHGYPFYSSYIWGENCKTAVEFLKKIHDELDGIVKFSNYHSVKYYKQFLEIKENTDLDVFWNNGIFVNKTCEGCGTKFPVPWGARERCFCSVPCYNKSDYCKNKNSSKWLKKHNENKENIYNIFVELRNNLNRNPKRSEVEKSCLKQNVSFVLHSDKKKNTGWFTNFNDIVEYVESKELNYQVINIEEDGFEDVYNGTVDDNHNFYVRMNDGKSRTGKHQQNYILNRQCGEAVLENYGSCCLGSLVLPSFITGNVNTNWKKLENIIKLSVRFLDNILDVNKYSLKEIEMKAQNSRRIGLGILGLAEYLFAKQLRYGSKDALDEIEKLMRFIRDTTYQASVELSVEKGSFPKFEPNQYGNSSFVRKLPAQLRMDIKNKGIRNVTLMSMAPNGTISLLSNHTGGIEPLMFRAYKRKDRVSERIYIHPKYRELILSGNPVPDWFVSSGDLQPKDHLETQSIIQKYTDGAVSKTLNLPKGTTPEQLSDLLLEYIRDLKGCTVYVDGARSNQVYNNLSEEEVFDIIASQTIGITALDETDLECSKCSSGNKEVEPEVCEISKKENQNA